MRTFLRPKLALLTLLVLLIVAALPIALATLHPQFTHAASSNTYHAQKDWPMFGFDTKHTHFNPFENVINSSNAPI